MTKRRGRRPYHSRRFDHGAPIWKPNLLPLASVWLTFAGWAAAGLPISVHAIIIDLPMVGSVPVERVTDPQTIVVGPDAEGRTRWDGAIITDAELVEYANEARSLLVSPIISFRPDPMASYGRSFEILAILNSAGLTDTPFCFGDIQRHAQFARSDTGTALHSLLTVTPGPFPADQADCDTFEDAPPPHEGE